MPKLTIMHLSDMHFRDSNSYSKENVRSLVNALHDNVVGINNLLILVSGDLSYSGYEVQYREIDQFFDDLVKNICERETHINDIRIFTVPGNHDLDNTKGKLTADKLQIIVGGRLQDDYLDKEFCKLENYSGFAKEKGIIEELNSFVESKTIEMGGHRIQINLINTAPFSLEGKGDEDKHYIPKAQLESLTAYNTIDYIFTIMHHPHYWFDWDSKHLLDQLLIEKSDIVFVGHEHFSACKDMWEGKLSTKFQEGGKLSNLGNWNSSEFYVGTLDLETRAYRLKKYQWNNTGKMYFPSDMGPTILSKNRWNKYGYSVDQGFLRSIVIDERFLIGQDIRSFYVFPELEENKDIQERRPLNISSMDQFLNHIAPGRKLLIRGGKEAGKSVLSQQIFLSAQNDFIPVLLDEADFCKVAAKKESVEEAIESAFKREYACGNGEYENFVQEQSEKKIAIIDGFDYVDHDIQKDIVEYIEDRFGIIVLTCQRDIQFKLTERARLEKLLDGYQNFTICPFYKSKREMLIDKVVKSRTKNKEEQDIVKTAVTRLLSGSRQLYRWDPTFIIQISMYASDNARTIKNKEGNVFGTVFLHTILNLLVPELEKINFDTDYALTIIDKIAYAAYKKRLSVLPADLVLEEVSKYIKDYKYKRCSAVEFINALKNARIIREIEGDYCFCQTTFYAFFVAREIRRIFQDKHDYTDFMNAVMEAYHPINLSVVLFVLYIMDSSILIEEIKNMAEKAMEGLVEFDPKNPTQSYFLNMCYSAPTITEDDQKEHERAQDETERTFSIQNQNYWEDIYKEDVESRKMSLRLSLMIIVSQLLPNLGHIIPGDPKMEFVNLIYTMPLKIFNVWASEIDKDKASIIQEIKHLSTLEYRHKSIKEMTDAEAVQYLREESITLLLELMDLSITNASRSTTYDLLDEFNHRAKPCYDIEWLISHEKRNTTSLFISEADRVCKENKTGILNVMTKLVVRHYLMTNHYMEYKDLQRINSIFFEGKLPLRLFYIESKTRTE